jgi:predicted ArsR family transcriptional regulator
MPSFEARATGIGSLADPVRRALYQYVCEQPGPVSRDQSAAAVGVAAHRARFHLDRLESAGLLVSEFARVGDRSGPGAGRTSKLYRRAPVEVSVSLPDREYELAGRLMADAISMSDADGTPVRAALEAVARAYGGAAAREAVGSAKPVSSRTAMDRAVDVLAEHGYEPRRHESRVELANCPFHALAARQAALVCAMNHALVDGVVAAIRPDVLTASLDPGPGRCCVVLGKRTAPNRP